MSLNFSISSAGILSCFKEISCSFPSFCVIHCLPRGSPRWRLLQMYMLKPSNTVFQNVTAGVKVFKELVKLKGTH